MTDMSGPAERRQKHSSNDDGSLAGGLHLPRDVWNVILSAAAAPLQSLPRGEDGRANVARWRALALVCKQWREIMLQQPVGLRLDDHGFSSGSGRHAHPLRTGSDTAVLAVYALAVTWMPVSRLHITIDERMLTSGPEDRPEGNETGMMIAVGELFKSTHFQAVSGPHLVEVMYRPGFVLKAPPEAFPKLQHLCYTRTRLRAGLPPSLLTLGLKGDLSVSFGSGFISASEVGARTDDAIPWILPLRQLFMVMFSRCCVSREMLAALPPSLRALTFHQCRVPAEEHLFPPQLCRINYEIDHAGLFSGTFDLAGRVIHDPRRQLAPVAMHA